MKRLTTLKIFFVLALSLLVGCASIDPKPFEQFNASLVELDKGATSSLDVTIPLVESRYRTELVDELSQGNTGLLDQVAVVADGSDPFFISNPPLFLMAQKFKQGIAKVNQVWLEYAQLLVQLSAKDVTDETDFKQIATDLNAGALDAMQTIRDNPSDSSVEDVAFFSEGAATALEAFVKAKTKRNLIDIMTGNQQAVADYVVQMQSAVVSMAQISTQEYSEKQQVQQRALTLLVIGNENGKNDAKIQKSLNDIIDVKRTHSAQMVSLQSLHTAYGKIPAAHAALAKRLQVSNASIADISALLEKGVQMHTAYESTAKANKAALVQAQADAANSRATAAELLYQQAQFDYTLAQNALSASPDDADLQQDAEDKKAAADELQLEADTLKASATALRAAATAIQSSASDVQTTITEN